MTDPTADLQHSHHHQFEASELPLTGHTAGDSDVDSSHSICSGSDTHSGHTSLSLQTDKSSASATTIHANAAVCKDNLALSPEPDWPTVASDSHSPTTATSAATPFAIITTTTITPPSISNSQNVLCGTSTSITSCVVPGASGGSGNVNVSTRGTLLPWGVPKERTASAGQHHGPVDMDIRPGEYVMRTLFADFTQQAEKKIESVLSEPQEKSLSKLLQRGEDAVFDQLLGAFGSVAEHCLPSLLRALFSWYERQMSETALLQQNHCYQFIHGGSAQQQQLALNQQQHGRQKSDGSSGSVSAGKSGSNSPVASGAKGSVYKYVGIGAVAGTVLSAAGMATGGNAGLVSSVQSASMTSSNMSATNLSGTTSGISSISFGSSTASSSLTLGSAASGTVSTLSSVVSSGAVNLSSVTLSSSETASERNEAEVGQDRRDLAVEFLFCLVLIEVLRQLSFHPGHEDLVAYIENVAFRHFKYKEGSQSGPNATNIHIIADLYAEVIGALAQSRFMSVRTRFCAELKELRARDSSPNTTQSIISLLMGMKFFRVKMVPIEEFEASFQFMQECAQYFLDPNVKDKDIKHALAGLFVEILVPVAASVKNEVNVPCLKNFVEMLYSSTLDASTKSKHRLALFPLITCLLCVSQKAFFLQNWHCFLAMCLSHLKNRDQKMCRVALESLYRLLWVYMIRIKCESNSATQSRLQSIVNSLFPKGSKAVVPRDTPLNIFVKIIQFIAQERLDFAMREIVFDLLSVGRPIKIILTPERMSIGLRAFLVVADSLQQKEGEPPMPRAMGVLPSGNTLRVRKTFLNKMLTEDTARSIGMSAYFPHVRRVFVDILRALDAQYGRPLMMTNTQNLNKEPDEMLSGERKPRIDLFRTCVAAVPRLIPDGMTDVELVDLLARLTVHMDEELRGLAFQSLQTLVVDFADWRQDVICGVTQFIARDVPDTSPQLVDSGLRMLLQLLNAWKTAMVTNTNGLSTVHTYGMGMGTVTKVKDAVDSASSKLGKNVPNKTDQSLTSVLHYVEAFALVMLCHYRPTTRRLSVHILREVKALLAKISVVPATPGVATSAIGSSVIDVMDACCNQALDKCLSILPATERTAISTATIDMLWIADRSSAVWTAGLHQDDSANPTSTGPASTPGSGKAATNVAAHATPSGASLSAADPWAVVLFAFLERDRLLSACPAVIAHCWPIVYGRMTSLYTVIDPTPVNDNRASLLRSSATIKKPVNERDLYIHLWKNYITFACRVIPPMPSPVIRCASPDLSLSSMEVNDRAVGDNTIDLSSSLENLNMAAAAASSHVAPASAPVASSSDHAGLLSVASFGDRFTLPLSAIRRQHKRSSSSPDSLIADRGDGKSPSGALGATVSPSTFYKLVVPLLRCEVADVRDAAVMSLGCINSDAFKDLMEELVVYIREAVDRKQENVRRRRRRDALRLQLCRVLELIAEYGTFAVSPCVLLPDQRLHSHNLHSIFVEYLDGVRLCLEAEPDKTSAVVRELTMHLCSFVRKLIRSFSLDTCQTLLDSDLRRTLFGLLSTWSGYYGSPIVGNAPPPAPPPQHHHYFGAIYSASDTDVPSALSGGGATGSGGSAHANSGNMTASQLAAAKTPTDLQMTALRAMSALLCCGTCFNADKLLDEGCSYYQWLDIMLNSCDEKVYELGKETVVLLLECNPDIGPLLDWAVDRCYTGSATVADGCFLSLATIFSAREYPCDHYTAVINVTLMNTGCPRPAVRDTALQLLQVLDKRFFGNVGPLAEGDLAEGDNGRSTLDALLAATYCRSQMHLSSQLALLHPELTMPMFSEVTVRFQTARPEVRQLLLQYILPWLHNMELVDPNIPPSNPLFYYQFHSGDSSRQRGRREGWGSAEATEMVLNNIFYITVKFGDNHPKEIEELWATLCTSWPNNMKIIIRYLIIISGMAPSELLPYAKRVVLFLARVQPVRLLDEMMFELQTVETLNCLIERTETPPFFRLTVMRKASSHSDGTGTAGGQSDANSRCDLGVEKGTIHTKRHSGEDPLKCGTPNSKVTADGKNLGEYSPKTRGPTGAALVSDDLCTPTTDENMEDLFGLTRGGGAVGRDAAGSGGSDRVDMSVPQPMPLPMPEYGGFFAPLSRYLPDSSQPIAGFHRCNVAVMLLCDIVVDGVELDWTVQVPLMLHILFLGMDHTRPIVHQHCTQLLLNLLVVLGRHNDHLTVAQILLSTKSSQPDLGLPIPALPVVRHIFTEPDSNFDTYLHGISATDFINASKDLSASSSTISTTSVLSNAGDKPGKDVISTAPVIVTPDQEIEAASWTAPELAHQMAPLSTAAVIKSMIEFLSTRQLVPLWNYEDITAKVWQVKSAEQMDSFLQHVLRVFQDSLPNAHISDRWAQTALQIGLSCSSRHYAGRSLQIFRSLRIPISVRMLSDILSRLVETVAEQGEDMQGYVTELLLTLESAVDSLESDFRPLDFLRDFFKSTPNLNNKDLAAGHNTTTSLATTAATAAHVSPGAGGGRLHRSPPLPHSGNAHSSSAVPGSQQQHGGVAHAQVVVQQQQQQYDVVPPLGGGVSGSASPAGCHGRSTSYSVSYGLRKSGGSSASGGTGNGGICAINEHKEIRGRTSSEVEPRSNNRYCNNLARSRSAHSLKLLGDSTATHDDKLTILAQLFWLAVSLLESDYEHEFLLALRLLARVLHRLPLDRPDARDKVEKLQTQLRWSSFPGVHALLLKGCTHPNIYEPVVALLSQFTALLDLQVVDPSQSIAFPMNVIALLPYMLLNYEDANHLCISSAENIAQVSIEKSKKLENLGTVMNLYSRRTFSKESFQWTKCVVKYLYDTYAHLSLNMLTFLVEVLEKGPANLQLPVLNILHCMLHYIDLASAAAQPINADLLRVIARYIEGAHWKEALKILKLVVTRSSSLVAPPTSLQYHSHWDTSMAGLPHPSFSDVDVFTRKELPGRTMDFTFDLSQTPVIGRRLLAKSSATSSFVEGSVSTTKPVASPRRSCSLSPADTGPLCGWKRPWMSQGRVRECLVNLLTTCGQRVGLPKSPSVIFSQSSDLLERQSSMASSTEEVSAGNNDLSGGSRRDDATADFGVFKDFDFLEYESESIEAESTDNFNWGVRRRPLSEGEEEPVSLRQQLEDSVSEQTPVLAVRKNVINDESSDDEIGSESPLDEIATAPEFDASTSTSGGNLYPPTSLRLNIHARRDSAGARSDTSESSGGDLGDVTPCNDSPNVSTLISSRPLPRSETIENWNNFVHAFNVENSSSILKLFHQLQKLTKNVTTTAITITRDACGYLCQTTFAETTTLTNSSSYMAISLASASTQPLIKLISVRLSSLVDIVSNRILSSAHHVWFNTTALGGIDSRLAKCLRYGVLEVQEHLETFCSRLEQATMYSDTVKTSIKLEMLSSGSQASSSANAGAATSAAPSSADSRHEDYLLELTRSLYKLYFQLLLLIESINKMTASLVTGLKSAGFRDISRDVCSVRETLVCVAEEADTGRETPPTPQLMSPTKTSAGIPTVEEVFNKNYEFVVMEKWTAALAFIQHNRGMLVLPSDTISEPEDNVSLVINTYCRKLMAEKPDCFVITNQESDMGDIYGRLFQVSAALNDLEGIINSEFMQNLQK